MRVIPILFLGLLFIPSQADARGGSFAGSAWGWGASRSFSGFPGRGSSFRGIPSARTPVIRMP